MKTNIHGGIAVNSFADSTLDIQLVGGSDIAFIEVSLADVVNLSAIGKTVAGTFSATANADASVSITDGHLSGTDSTLLTVDATASADGATVHLHVTDRLQFDLSGTGYAAARLTLSTHAGGSRNVSAGSNSSADGASSYTNKALFEDDKGLFDLSRFASSVLGELHIISFAMGRGTLSGVGSSVLTIDATADLSNGQQLTFDKVRSEPIAFSSGSSDQNGVTALYIHLNNSA